MKRLLAVLVIFLAAPLLAGCIDRGYVGEPMPAFQVVTTDGVPVNETTHLGQWLVLDLMATWCAPCEVQTRHLQQVQQDFGEERVAILSISVDPGERLEDLEAFAEKNGILWPHALDPGGEVGRTFRADRLPTVLVIDPEGIVVEEGQGELLPAAIARVIAPGSAPAPSTLPVAGTLAALVVGAAAWLNPYQRFHRPRSAPSDLAALAAFAGIGLLAWMFLSEASARATLGSLFVGAFTLGAVAWWFRARKRDAPADPPRNVALQAGDRVYEAAPHFAVALVLALQQTSAIGYALPLGAFLVGALVSTRLVPRLDARTRTSLGLVGLALVGIGLLAFGARLVIASA